MPRKGLNLSITRESLPRYGKGRTVASEMRYSSAALSGLVVMDASVFDDIEKDMENLRRKAALVSQTLQKAGVPHAVAGGLAVAAHVRSVNPYAVRNTGDLDLLLDPHDFDRAGEALKALHYRYRKVLGISIFARKGEKFEEAVHIVRAGEKVRPEYLQPAPDVPRALKFVGGEGFVCLDLARLVTMKLTSFRHKDIVHVQDLLKVGLITKKVASALPANLLDRLEYVKEETKREYPG